MKQILTIFRAEGPQAERMLRLCRKTRKALLFELRNLWREQARSSSNLTAYFEYMDGWSMFDDFERVMGVGMEERCTPSGAVYFRLINTQMRSVLQHRRKRKQQFPEQTMFVRTVSDIALGCGACEPPIALAVFREIVGTSMFDEDLKEGSTTPLKGIASSQRVRGAK